VYERADAILDNRKVISEAYGIEEGDRILIYMKDFMEFEMKKKLIHFNLDDNEYMLKNKWDKKDIYPFMNKYVSTTFYFERGAWMFDFMGALFKGLVEHRDWSNYSVGVKAYSDTLATNHNWLLQNTVKFILLAIADRDGFEKMYMKEQAGVRNNGLPYTL